MTAVVLAIGANLGDRLAALQGAVDALAATAGVVITAVSAVYETEPVGGPEQPAYLNAVVIIETDASADDILARAQAIEHDWQRTREVRWGPRTLDIDVIDVAGRTSDDPRLTLPHPRARERAFVLVPWLDADPAARLTGTGPIAELDVDPVGVRRTDVRLVAP